MKFLKTFQQFTNAVPQEPGAASPKPETTRPVSFDFGLSRKQPAEKGSVHVFTTPQSLATFPIASTSVMVIWKVLGKIFPSWGASYILLLVIALAIGMVIYLIGINDRMTARQKLIALCIAVINSFFLMASALGILQSINT
ncbi:MAG: hypothetical protein HY841_03580 [Bacteroidetes bacterium]|nr:hypothetical protein [Bacteroidota bacterium]